VQATCALNDYVISAKIGKYELGTSDCLTKHAPVELHPETPTTTANPSNDINRLQWKI
jgi:hypothetical protein